MKRTFILFSTFVFILVTSVIAFGQPPLGTWNSSKLGTPELQGLTDPGIFQGKWWYTDPERDGMTLGDVFYARDISSPSIPFTPRYWGISNMVRDTINRTPIVDQGNGTGIAISETSRSGGTFTIWGDRLWGQSAGAIYTASIDGLFTGKLYYIWDGTNWIFDHNVLTLHLWGTFNGYPLLFDFTSTFANDPNSLYNDQTRGWLRVGSLDNVAFQIRGVPEPTTMLLLGLGLVGLAGIRRKMQ